MPIQVRYGWRASFYLFGFLGVIWAAVWYAWFRDSPAEKPGVTSVELLELGGEPPVGHGGMPWGQALRSGTLWRITAIGACYVYAIAFFQSWLQTYLVKGHGYSEAALVLSSLPYVVGGCANGIGGVASDWLVRRFGLKTGRRALGVVGLSVAAIFMAATIATTSGGWALIFLSLAYAGILAQQPNLCAVCLDTGRGHAGAVFGFMNTAANAASAVSSIVFGYLVAYFGNYNAPFVPMVATLCLGALAVAEDGSDASVVRRTDRPGRHPGRGGRVKAREAEITGSRSGCENARPFRYRSTEQPPLSPALQFSDR